MSLHMPDKSRAKAIAESLNKSYFHHGYPVGRTEAKNIGLPIIDPEDELEQNIWKVWESIELEMECCKPFSPVEIAFQNEETAITLQQVLQVDIPVNLPADLLNQAYKQVLQQIAIKYVDPIEYQLFHATLESTKCRSEHRTKGFINITRKPDMTLSVNLVQTSGGWQHFICD